MEKKWSVYYGCEEWQDVNYYDSEFDARNAFVGMSENPPNMGSYPADFIYLHNSDEDTIDSFVNEENKEDEN